ncbi:sodium:solute symporter family protein [Candidatus Calescamantes bacterium]|nr:sodium:solute symporter family protein [Candidatus Calescamantes bacterium]
MSIQLFIIIAYFAFLIFLGWLAKSKAKTSSDFLLAGRSLGISLATVTIVGEWLGANSTIGTSEMAFRSGFSPLWYNVSTALGMVIFALTLSMVYRRNKVHTVGEMIEKIYNRKTRVVASFAFLIAFYILAFVQLRAIGSLLSPVLGLSPQWCTLIGGIVVTAYTVFGGIWAVSFTNMAHVILMYSTLIVAFTIGLIKVGGFSGLFELLDGAIQARPELYQANATVETFKSPFGFGVFKAISWILGGMLAAFASQASIQPVFATKDIKTARNASLLSALFIAPLGLLVSTLGMIVATGKFGLPATAKQALPHLFMNPDFMPPWLGGLAMAGILAAILSTISPVMLAISTIMTKDVYHLILHKEADDKKLLKVSQLVTLVVGLIVIPAAMFFKGYILDTSYISYAIRASGSVIVILGLLLIVKRQNDKFHFITPVAAKFAIVTASLASLGVVLFKISVVSTEGAAYWAQHYAKNIFLDKIYVSLMLTFVLALGISIFQKQKVRLTMVQKNETS